MFDIYIYTHNTHTVCTLLLSMGMVRIFKCVWKKPLMLIYMVNWCATTKIWMYNWVLPTQEMLVVKQVLGIAKKFACPRQRAEQRADLIFCTLVNVMLFLHAIGPGLSVGLFDNVKKKKTYNVPERVNACDASPAQPETILSLYLQGIEFHIFQLSHFWRHKETDKDIYEM